MKDWLSAILVCIAALTGQGSASAGELDRNRVERLFPHPMIVGEKDERIPVWPLFQQNGTKNDLVGYAFESVDLAPIPGFSGTPPNLLVELTPDGVYRSVRVVSHHEPVFLEGLGEEPLFRFVEQYAGLNIRQPVKVGSNINSAAKGSSTAKFVDGVAKATASVKIINESVLAAALKVARAKLGFAEGRDPGLKVTPKAEVFEPRTFNDLVAAGLVQRRVVTNAEVEKAFAGTIVEGVDSQGLMEPDASFIEVHVAYLNTPMVGRNLLGAAAYERLMAELAPGHHGLILVSTGRWSALGDDFVRGSVPDRMSLQQGGLRIDLRDLAIERRPPIADFPDGPFTILKVFEQAGLDPSSPWQLDLRVTREKGQILPERVSADFDVVYGPDPALFLREVPEKTPAWVELWRSRAHELGAISLALGILAIGLSRQNTTLADPLRLAAFRWAFLGFTVLFVGWYAQAQLSIVTLTGLVKAAVSTRDLSFLIYDPPSLLLWGFVIVTAVIWGRGTFCGWLCPFGAMQEFVAWLTRPLKIRQIAVSPALDRRLRWIKYVVLAGLLASAAAPGRLAEALAEVEPFKTSVTMVFVRSWPFVVYAAGLLVLNLFIYKAFCRYLCPLGAGLALLGRLRVLDWIPRRRECGSPCQLCKVRCRYGAIERSGRIRYDECFQCLDCVSIFHDPGRCVPRVIGRKHNVPHSPGIAA